MQALIIPSISISLLKTKCLKMHFVSHIFKFSINWHRSACLDVQQTFSVHLIALQPKPWMISSPNSYFSCFFPVNLVPVKTKLCQKEKSFLSTLMHHFYKSSLVFWHENKFLCRISQKTPYFWKIILMNFWKIYHSKKKCYALLFCIPVRFWELVNYRLLKF